MLNLQTVSLNAQHQLDAAESASARAARRLSSGLRINSAADDAAGLAIGARLSARLGSLNEATRNASDGISMAQVADGALGSVGDILQRIRELAVEAANSTESASDRQGLDQEAQQLRSEIDRIVSTTQFNGVTLLSGSASAQSLQIGVGAADKLNFAVPDTRWSTIAPAPVASPTSLTGVDVDYTNLDAGNMTIDSGSGPVAIVAAVGTALRQPWTAYAKAQAINASNVPGVTATASSTKVLPALTGADINSSNDAVTLSGLTAVDYASYQLDINGYTVIQTAWSNAPIAIDVATYAAAIEAQFGNTGVHARVVNGAVELSNPDGTSTAKTETFTVSDGVDGAANTNIQGRSAFYGLTGSPGGDGNTTSVSTGWLFNGQVTLTSATPLTLAVGGTPGATSPWATLGFAGPNIATGGVGSGPGVVDLTSAAGAQATLATVDTALAAVSSGRVQLGATLSRLDAVVAANGSASTTLQAVKSRVVDADIAVESTALVRATIIRRAASALLAQANASASQVLQLLK